MTMAPATVDVREAVALMRGLSMDSVSKFFSAALAAVLGTALLSAAPATAAPAAGPTITGTTFGSWNIDYWGSYNPDMTPVEKVSLNARTVSGTSTGAPGDIVHVYCVTKNPAKTVRISDDVAVQADGSWVANTSTHTLYTRIAKSATSCKLAAIWQGETPPTFAEATGLEVHVMQMVPTVRNGVFEDLWVSFNGTEGFVDFGTNANCSLCDTFVANPADGTIGNSDSSIFWWNASLWGSYTSSPGVGKSLLTVDDREVWSGYQTNVYAPFSAANLRTVDISYALDPVTGVLTFTEKAQLSYCPADATLTKPDMFECTAMDNFKTMSDAGVRHTRVTTVGPDGMTYNVDDLFESTDGQAHTIDVRYFEASIATTGNETDIKFPAGVTGVAGDTWIDGSTITSALEVTGFSPGATTLQFTRNDLAAPGYANPVGFATYFDEPDKVSGIDPSAIAVEYLDKVVDATHDFTSGANYAMAASQAVLDAHAANALADIADYQAPATITWNPTLSVKVNAKQLSALATAGGPGISYSVENAGTTACTINSSTGAVTFAAPGTCVLRATAAATRTNRLTTKDVSLTVSALCTIGADAIVKFTSDTAGLSASAKTQLRRVAAVVRADRCTKLSIVGDGPMTKKVKGSFAARKAAATKRANVIKTYLTTLLKTAGFTVTITALGKVRSDSAAIDKTAAIAKTHLKATISAKL